MVHLNKCLFMIGVPLAFSVLAVLKNSIILFAVYILAHFVIMKIMPAFRKYENVGMFVLVAFSSVPINIYITKLLADMKLYGDGNLLVNALRGVLYYMVLLSLEEVVMGILTRIIWKNQDC